jgi:hypothetical protein
MTAFRILTAAALVAAAAAASAQTSPAVNLDGSTNAAPRGPTLAASANRSLRQASVPSQKSDLAAQANADINRRQTQPRLKAERENLKGPAAARALAQQQNAANYDRNISMGDKDHTQQVTDMKVYIKK